MASNVDLPAPLGPISPVSVPARTENETSSTARTPPNSRETPTTSSTTPPAGASRAPACEPGELRTLGCSPSPSTCAEGVAGRTPGGPAGGWGSALRPPASGEAAPEGEAAAGAGVWDAPDSPSASAGAATDGA